MRRTREAAEWNSCGLVVTDRIEMIYKKVLLIAALNAVMFGCDSTSILSDGDTDTDNGTGSGVAIGSDGNTGPNVNAVTDSGQGTVSTGTDSDAGAGTDNTVSDNTVSDSASDNSVSDSATDADNSMNLVGLLKLEGNRSGTEFSRALFGRLDRSLTAGEIEQWYAPSTDVCEVSLVDNESDSAVPDFNVFEQELTLISGGENVILTSDAGTYATLNRVDGESPFYRTDVTLIGDVPPNLSLDIPGDEFPAFSNVEIGDVTDYRVLSPVEGQTVTPDTEFSWIANNVPRSVIEIYVGGTGVNNESIAIGCTVVDDGSFNFPASIRAAMGTNFTADWTASLRIIYKVAQNGNAIVFTANSIVPQ